MTPLHQYARYLLGRTFANQHLDLVREVPWSDADLHRLRALGEQAGKSFDLAAKDAIDALDQAREVVRSALTHGEMTNRREEYRSHWHRAASALDALASRAELSGK